MKKKDKTSKELDKLQKQIRGMKWLVRFRQLKLEAFSIIEGVCTMLSPSFDDDFEKFKEALGVIGVDPHSDKHTAIMEAIVELPKIAERMKAVSKSDEKLVRRIQECEVNAVNAFSEACVSGIAWAQEPQNRRLRATMWWRFAQAWKSWKLSNRISAAFWEDSRLR